MTEAEVRRQLAEEESAAIAEGATVLHETSASGFLSTAIMLEDTQ